MEPQHVTWTSLDLEEDKKGYILQGCLIAMGRFVMLGSKTF